MGNTQRCHLLAQDYDTLIKHNWILYKSTPATLKIFSAISSNSIPTSSPLIFKFHELQFGQRDRFLWKIIFQGMMIPVAGRAQWSQICSFIIIGPLFHCIDFLGRYSSHHWHASTHLIIKWRPPIKFSSKKCHIRQPT